MMVRGLGFFALLAWVSIMGGVCASAHAQTQPMVAATPQDGLNLETDAFFFRSGSTNLMPESATRLEALAAVLQTSIMAGTCLRLVGHSDTVGAEQANQAVSLKRAEYVRDRLLEMLPAGLIPIDIAAMGEAEPLPNMAGDDPRNRRVVIWAKKCAP